MRAMVSGRTVCVPRRRRTETSCNPANAWTDGRFTGPPNERGCRNSLRAAGVCASQSGPDARRGAAAAVSTDISDSTRMLPAMVNARRGDAKNRMKPVEVSGERGQLSHTTAGDATAKASLGWDSRGRVQRKQACFDDFLVLQN